MQLLQTFRVLVTLNVMTMVIQAGFAGRMIGGDHQSFSLHESTAKILVLLACSQVMIAFMLRRKYLCPLWVPLASCGLLVAEVIEYAAGHLHHVAWHVP